MADKGGEDDSAPLISGSYEQNEGSPSTSLVRRSNHFAGRGRQKLLVTLCILVTELCERLTFYGLTANLVLFCGSALYLDPPWPSVTSYLFQGTCYFIPLFGGWLADAYLGRYNTIYVSSLWYVVGTVLVAAVSRNDYGSHYLFDRKAKLAYFVCALVMIAFGTGGIKANVSPFGADQVEQDGPRVTQTFFNWFYWFINVGALVAFTVVVGVQQTNVFYGYVITVVTMLLAVIVFVSGRNKYLTKPPRGSQLTETGKIIYNAWKRRHTSADARMWLDKAKSSFGGKYTDVQVEDVKSLLRVIPVFAMFIMYWAVYSQMQTTFLIQATFMTLKISSFTLPAASLSVFDTVAVLALIPIMDRVVYPLLQYCGIRFTPLRRIGVGMLLAAASVVVAGVIEIKRKDTGHFVNQTVFGELHHASGLNVFWQVPQFMLIGSSEVLASISGLEFAYSQAPSCLKGLVMGMFLVTTGLGSYAAALLVVIVEQASGGVWYPSKYRNVNEGHLEYFFFLLAGLMVVNFIVFRIVALNYKYTAVRKREIIGESRESIQPT